MPTANDNAAPTAIITNDLGDGATAVSCGPREVRIAANAPGSWGASAAASGCAVGAFAGKTYKSHAAAVKAASKWLAARVAS